MGDFGKFGTFSKPSTLGEAREEPTVLTPTKEVIPEARKVEAATKKIAKPRAGGKPIDTYEQRLGGINKLPHYGGMPLGCMARFEYARWQHDPTPLVILTSAPASQYNCLSGLNLHYLPPKQQQDVVIKLLYMMNGFIVKGIPLQIQYRMLKPLFRQISNYVPYRLYKVDSVKGFKYIPVNQWVNSVKRTRTILPG